MRYISLLTSLFLIHTFLLAEETPAFQKGIKLTEPMVVVSLKKTGSYSQIEDAFNQLVAWADKKGYTLVPFYTGVFYNSPEQVPEEELLWEVMIPLADDISPEIEGEIEIKVLEPMKVAYTYYRGPYEQSGSAISGLMKWAVEKGYVGSGPVMEVYWRDPEVTPPEKLLSEIRIPVREK